MSYPPPTRHQARARGQLGLEVVRQKREQRKVELWRQLARGECLKRAAYNVGISYTTAKQYRKEA